MDGEDAPRIKGYECYPKTHRVRRNQQRTITVLMAVGEMDGTKLIKGECFLAEGNVNV